MKKSHQETKRKTRFFSIYELILLISSHALILLAFFISPLFGAENSILSMITSMIGVWGIILISKANYVAHYIYIVYAVLYTILSVCAAYYGEAIIYAFFMLPIHIFSIISWKKNLTNASEKEVGVKTIGKRHALISMAIAVLMTVPFYYLLIFLNTENPIFSTLSLSTSVLAAYFMLRQTSFFSAIFAIDDLFLLLLWGSKIISGNYEYIPTLIVCLCFLINDIYSAACWLKRAEVVKERTY